MIPSGARVLELLSQVARGLRLLHDSIGQPDAKGLLEAEQELDALETADAEIAIQRRVGPDSAAGRGRAQLCEQPGDDVEDTVLDSRLCVPHGRVRRRGR